MAIKPDIQLNRWEYDALKTFLTSVSERIGNEQLRKWILYVMWYMQLPLEGKTSEEHVVRLLLADIEIDA